MALSSFSVGHLFLGLQPSPLGMGAESRERPEQTVRYRPGDKPRALELEERREREERREI